MKRIINQDAHILIKEKTQKPVNNKEYCNLVFDYKNTTDFFDDIVDLYSRSHILKNND